MRNETSVSHVPIAIIMIIIDLFQIAILAYHMSLLQGDDRNVWKTYARIAINSAPQVIAREKNI